MSLVRLTLRNASRAPVRAALTVVAVAITLIAFVLLRTLSAGWRERVAQTPDDRVITRHQIGWARPLPVHYADAVRGMPGVKRVAIATFLPLKLPGKDGVFFQSSAVNAREFVDMHFELTAPAEQKAAFVADRHAAMVGSELAEEQGWRIGQQLHFERRDRAERYEVTLAAIAKSKRVGFGQRAVWIHWEYLNETLPPGEQDKLELIAAQIEDPRAGARLAKAIDIHFDTAVEPTFSQEDKALNKAIVGRFGALLGAMNTVSLLVLGVVVLILGNTIAMATRERVREYGTLRAIGFEPAHLVAFVLGEAAALGLAGGGLGLLLGYPLVEGPLSRYLREELGTSALRVAPADALLSLSLGAVLGLVAAGIPALRAARLQVTESLSHVA